MYKSITNCELNFWQLIFGMLLKKIPRHLKALLNKIVGLFEDLL